MPTIKKLHPTLKACKCGMIGSRSQLYSHLDHEERQIVESSAEATLTKFYSLHGEVPLNEDDPRTKVENQLERSLTK